MLVAPSSFRRLVRARELLLGPGRDSLSVRDVARHVGLSHFHFIRQFAALYGHTPHQLRTHARLDHAKRLLTSGASVTDVCLEVGFSSLGSFSTLFRREVGVSPTGYRVLVQVPRSYGGIVIPGCFGLMTRLPPRNSREAPPR